MLLISILRGAARDVLLTALPHGGQGAARRNAWAAMSADATQARARRESEAALPPAPIEDVPVRTAR